LDNPDFTQYHGHTYNQKKIDEIYAYIKEDRINNSLKSHNYLPASLVAVLKDNEIKQLGCSVPNDIINDNFGKVFAGAFKLVSLGVPIIDIVDDTGSTETVNLYGKTGVSAYNTQIRSRVQIGQGSTTPLRTDFNVETPFTNGGVEDGKINTDNGSFILGPSQVQVGKIISPTAGSGVIEETCLYGVWFVDGVGSRVFLLSRDSVSSLSFEEGEGVSVRYFWSF